jgi:glycosyltransferase involved in cell wall biosynthesis
MRLIHSLAKSLDARAILNGQNDYQLFAETESWNGCRVWRGPLLKSPSVNGDAEQLIKGLREVFQAFQPDIIHVFQVECWRNLLVQAIGDMDIKIVATALDYGWFCPKTTLVRETGLLCDGHGSREKCSPCLTGGRDPIVRAGRWLGKQLPASFSNTPILGALVKDAAMNQARLNLTLNAWPQFLKSISHWIAPSRAMQRLLTEQGVAPESISHIPYGYDAPEIKPVKRTGQNIVFGYAGRGIYEKGFHLLAEAFPVVARRFPDVRLRLFGISQSERHRYTKQSLEKLRPVWHRVDFDTYDGTKAASITDAHSKISAMIVPSIWFDNLPLTVVESLAHGTPLISSRHSSAADPVQDGVNGLLFDAFKPGDLAEKMSRFAMDTTLRTNLFAAASYKQSFADEGREVLGVYEGVLAAQI